MWFIRFWYILSTFIFTCEYLIFYLLSGGTWYRSYTITQSQHNTMPHIWRMPPDKWYQYRSYINTMVKTRQPAGGTPPLTDNMWDRGQCFSCGFHGHGVNRCSQLDISFPYKMPGWSVNVRNRQYRASRMRGDGQDQQRGKEGWFGQEGQPPGPSMTVTHLTQVGVIIRLGNDRWMTPIDPDGLQRPWFPSIGEPHSG